jgi:predicted Zn finger-like uncharacterized protein
MQILCPNCSTAYEIPDAVFGGRARKLRCENCGAQWRAGPPGAEPAPADETQAPGLPPEPAPRHFGKPVDAEADAEFRQAMDRERQTPTPPPAPGPAAEAEDPFINLVMAARSRAIEFEPEPPPEPRFKISSPALVGSLLTLFVLSVGFLLFHAR